MQRENNPNSAMLKELKQAKDEAVTTAATGEGGNPDGQAEELPQGSSPLEASAETSETQETSAEETPAAAQGDSSDEEGEVKLAGQTFKSTKEALTWAEERERERELTEAHTAGIREALEATRQPAQPDPEPEDDFEQRFYSNPKEALREVQARAVEEAEKRINANMTREKMWNDFLNEYPDLRRKDAERILNENWGVIGKMTDLKQAMKALAQRTRAEYDEIEQLRKPRTVLSDKKQVVSPSGGSPKGVTPQKNNDKPLDFAAQMRATFKR